MFRLILILTITLIACGGDVQGETTNQENQCEGVDCENDENDEAPCDGDDECGADQVCFGEACVDASQVDCTAGGTRCADGEVCGVSEVCDDDGECQEVRQCRIDCDGEVCGFGGELCCTGDTPVCGPHGECAPDCSDGGGVCGDDFDECCPWGDVCVFGECRTMGQTCDSFADCGFDEYCDPGLGRCMPDDFPDDLVCEADVDFDPFDIEELWNWGGVEIGNRFYENVQSIPVTADMTGDGTPEIVITPYHGGDQHNGILAVVDGVTGDTVYYNDRRTFSGQGHSAVADITGDGRPEIVTVLGDTIEGIAMVANPVNCPDPEADEDDCILWELRDGTVNRYYNGHAPLIADLNRDGNAEIVMGTAVINALTGDIIADGSNSSRAHNGLGHWGAATVADLDGDGTLEVLTGDCAWKVDFGQGELVEYWCNDSFSNGIPAVADIARADGRAGLAEVAVVRSGTLYILNGQTGDTIYSIAVPGGGDGGPPNIADFDGDGTVEIGLPGSTCYSVFDVACIDGADEPGECDQPQFPECTPGQPLPDGCVVDPCNGLPGGSGDGVLWSIEAHDGSMTTGSSVFDFQGNGRNEVVYNDECRLLVLDGQTGQPLISRINTTRTATEYPLVVDVNGDGRSNIAVIANNDQYSRDCEDFLTPGHSASRPDWFPECYPDDPADRPEACDIGTSGVYAFQDVNDAWVTTRAIWNQHAYHITNINDDATLPTTWENHWESYNTFRANRQGEVPLNAADVKVSNILVNALECPADIFFRATIENLGAASVPADMPVSLYLIGADGAGQLAETREVGQPIPPGGVVTMDFVYEISVGQLNQDLDFMIVANDDGADGSPVLDCNPDNASGLVEGVVCAYQL